MQAHHATHACPAVPDGERSRPTGCAAHRPITLDAFDQTYQRDPAAALQRARDEHPVFYDAALGYWVVTRFEDVRAVFHDHRSFSAANALEKVTPNSQAASGVLAQYGYAMGRTLVNEDEPVHLQRRRLLMAPFLPREVERLEPLVRSQAHAAIDRIQHLGRADLFDALLWPVPLTVALHFLGVPDEDMDLLRRYSVAHTVNTWGRPAPDEQMAVAHAVGSFWQLAGTILDKLRRDPQGPGWMRYGIRLQREHPDVITDTYLHSMMQAGIVAAHETTALALANAVKLLLQNRAGWRSLCSEPSGTAATVEECLRLDGSIAAWRRIALVDTHVGNVPVAAGDRLLLVMASANRDERRWRRPGVFDTARPHPDEHLSFGHGSHQCMGKHLARMQMRTVLQVLPERLPSLALEEQSFDYLPNLCFRGPTQLRVRWTA